VANMAKKKKHEEREMEKEHEHVEEKEERFEAEKTLKSWAPKIFIAGLVISLALGLYVGFGGKEITELYYLLLVFGLIVGAFNVTKEESLLYLVSIVSLLISTSLLSPLFNFLPAGKVIAVTLSYVAAFLGAGTVIVALRNLIDLARD
jgi:F0F1-type ATP synthase assembly protein I